MEPDLTPISVTDLLLADITIIAGILVLLTISIISEKQVISKFWGNLLHYIGLAPIAFIFSAGFLIEISLKSDVDARGYYSVASWAFLFGLGQLMVTLFIIVIVLAKNKENDQSRQSQSS